MVIPYLVFHGDCMAAIDFYRAAFPGEEAKILRYGDYVPEGSKIPPERLRMWVMHAEMKIGGTNVWFADEVTPAEKGGHIKLAVTVPTGGDANAVFHALCAGGTVTLPPTETEYSVFHAAVTDKFDVNWNIIAEEPPMRQEGEV